MNLDIVMLLIIIVITLVLFITEWLSMDLVALLSLVSLAITGLVAPVDLFKGFSNPAVITVWAMFILSEGLSRSGVTSLLSNHLLTIAGQSEKKSHFCHNDFKWLFISVYE